MYISGGLVISGDDSLSFCADGQSCKESQEHTDHFIQSGRML